MIGGAKVSGTTGKKKTWIGYYSRGLKYMENVWTTNIQQLEDNNLDDKHTV